MRTAAHDLQAVNVGPAVLPASPLSGGLVFPESRFPAKSRRPTLCATLFLFALPLLAQKTHEFCAPCHSEQVTDFQTHRHFQKGLSCDACHGLSAKHRTSVGAAPPDRVAAPDEVPALCGGCHSAERTQFLDSKHGKLVMARSRVKAATCTTCHGVHNPRSPAQTLQQCQKCHAALPAAHPARAATCMSCHARHTLLASGSR